MKRMTEVTNISFKNSEGITDEVQFDTQSETELAILWWYFCIDNNIIRLAQGTADYYTGDMIADLEDAVFVSVWDNDTVLRTPCKVNLSTREVFDIAKVNIEGIYVLDAQWIEVGKGNRLVKYDVVPKDALEDDDTNSFWYE